VSAETHAAAVGNESIMDIGSGGVAGAKEKNEEEETHVIELEDDASDAPHIARVRPAQLQDDLGRAVVSGGDHGGVVLPFEGGRT